MRTATVVLGGARGLYNTIQEAKATSPRLNLPYTSNILYPSTIINHIFSTFPTTHCPYHTYPSTPHPPHPLPLLGDTYPRTSVKTPNMYPCPTHTASFTLHSLVTASVSGCRI